MKIRSIKTWLENLPLTKPYTIAYKTTTHTEIVFLEITLENGVTGLGASNPFEDVVGETPADAFHNLHSAIVTELLVGKDIRTFQHLIASAGKLFPHLPGTLAAIDIALHDAFCKFLGISVLDFYGQQQEALPTSVTIGIKPADEMVEEARGYQRLGFRRLKIKTGLDVDADIERVLRLHADFGKQMLIRVDANQGYDVPALQKFINATNKIGLELIEQPMKAGREPELAVFPEADRKLLVADECLLDAGSAIKLAQMPQPYGVFNIKLMKCGGILGARQIATIAEPAGINLFWGCNDESIVSITAALHVAYSCSNTRFLDLDGSFDLSKDLVEGGFLLKDGYMYVRPEPGLGLTRPA